MPCHKFPHQEIRWNFDILCSLVYILFLLGNNCSSHFLLLDHKKPFRSSHQRCSIKKLFLKVSNNTQRIIYMCESLFNKVAPPPPPTVNTAKFLRTPAFKSICKRLLLVILLLMFLKAHRQISKKRCFEKYCSCDQACQVSALKVHRDGVI